MAMASSTFLAAASLRFPQDSAAALRPGRLSRYRVCVRGAGKEAEFGARDPFPAEIESNFTTKVLGCADTEHVILIPSMPMEISEKSCGKLPPGTGPMSEQDAKALLRKVVGWRLVNQDGFLKLQGEWNVKSFGAGVELLGRVAAVAESESYFPSMSLDQSCKVRVDIWTLSVGGVTENDFILAAKIDKLKTSDLVKRSRVWA